jgi:hypothetical protein
MPGGSLSPYGAELAAMLTYLAAPAQQQQVAAKAPLDGASWSQALAAYFGCVPRVRARVQLAAGVSVARARDAPAMQDAAPMACAHFIPRRSVYKGYQNHSIKTVIANVAAGKVYPETGDAQDTQANSLCKVCGLWRWSSPCDAVGWAAPACAAVVLTRRVC